MACLCVVFCNSQFSWEWWDWLLGKENKRINQDWWIHLCSLDWVDTLCLWFIETTLWGLFNCHPQFRVEKYWIKRDIRWSDQVTELVLVEQETEARSEFLQNHTSGWKNQKVRSGFSLNRVQKKKERKVRVQSGGKREGERGINQEEEEGRLFSYRSQVHSPQNICLPGIS